MNEFPKWVYKRINGKVESRIAVSPGDQGDWSNFEDLDNAVQEKKGTQAAPQEVKNPVKYSREELEAIAEEKGIKGLREIATPLGIKGRGITELIEELLL